MNECAEFERPTQEQMQTDLRELFRGAIRLTLELMLHEVVKEMVGAGKYERLSGRKDSRNGTYLRRLLTSMGLIEVAVPRTRENGSAGAALGSYRRRTEDLDEMIVSAYVNGVSTRKVDRLMQELAGHSVSSSTVSRITERLGEAVEKLRSEPLEEEIRYLYLDATFLDARWAKKVENISVLVAYGVTDEGKRRLLAITIGCEESEASWSELLGQLCERGLKGVRLVIADAHQGIAAAVRTYLPEAEYQRCTVHLVRNVTQQVPRRLRGRLIPRFAELFKSDSLKAAEQSREALRAEFGALVPEAFEVLDRGWSDSTRFYRYPKEHWTKIRTTNGLERLHVEIKRRVRSVGVFPDRASALRLVTAVVLQATEKWHERRYLQMVIKSDTKPGKDAA